MDIKLFAIVFAFLMHNSAGMGKQNTTIKTLENAIIYFGTIKSESRKNSYFSLLPTDLQKHFFKNFFIEPYEKDRSAFDALNQFNYYNPKILHLLLKAGINPNLTASGGYTLLHFSDNVPAIQTLLAHNANISTKDNMGWTLLHWAAFSNRPTQCLLTLLINNADPSLLNSKGQKARELISSYVTITSYHSPNRIVLYQDPAAILKSTLLYLADSPSLKSLPTDTKNHLLKAFYRYAHSKPAMPITL
jgi:hypothetical protein